MCSTENKYNEMGTFHFATARTLTWRAGLAATCLKAETSKFIEIGESEPNEISSFKIT